MNHQELKYQVLRYYELNKDKALRFESELDNLSSAVTFNEVVFPYKSTKEIENLNLEASSEDNLIKIKIPNNELSVYYPESYFSMQSAISAFELLLCEQSMESAHRYIKCPVNTSVIDVGCSEGIFPRMYCDRSNSIYGFDDRLWKDSFLKTTEGLDSYFISKLVTKDYRFEDKLLQPLGCIKIDVEGSELEVLQAFENHILEYHPILQIAVYHYHQEYKDIVNWLIDRGYTSFGQAIKGARMLFPHDDIQLEPYFRFGVIIATQ